jgi:NAD(P)-dependent dehydrogenase (short-subunit alcohol dehydrogenase family)
MNSTSNNNEGLIVLVTGATSGLGEEAAAQLADAGYAKVIVTGRTSGKAETASRGLVDRTGRDVFAPLTLDLDDWGSVDGSVGELASRGDKIDVLLLNAGLVAGKELIRTRDDVEATFAATLIGHHRFTMGLLNSGLLSPEARIVIAGSEAARGDVPTMSRTDLPTFAARHFNRDLALAAESLIRQQPPAKYKPGNAYADAKMFVALWTAALARRLPAEMTANAVSPGAAPDTQGARNAPFFMRTIMLPLMKHAPKRLAMAAPVSAAAGRYLQALTFTPDVSGQFFASKPKKMTGALVEMEHPHFADGPSQEAVWQAVVHLTGADCGATTEPGSAKETTSRNLKI